LRVVLFFFYGVASRPIKWGFSKQSILSFKIIHFETQNNPFSFLDFLGGFWARFGCRLWGYLFVSFLRVFGGGAEGLFLFAIHVKKNVIL
jgi:hypothetical protein